MVHALLAATPDLQGADVHFDDWHQYRAPYVAAFEQEILGQSEIWDRTWQNSSVK